MFNADVSVDFFTVAELTNSSLWYRTVMPGYSLSCRYDSFAGGNNLHRFDFRLKYFESNSFRVNTAELEPGTMRSFIFTAFGDYTRYLPITSNIDYITGLRLAGVYNSFGWVVSNEDARISKFFNTDIGPVNGLSVNITDRFEFRSLFTLTGGIPLYGKIEYPGDTEKSLIPVDFGMNLRSVISLNIRKLSISLYHDWSQDYILSIERGSEYFNPLAFNSQSVQSIGLTAGIKL